MLNTQSEGQSTTNRSDQCELEIRSDLPIPNQNVQSTLQPVGFAPKLGPYPNYTVHGGNKKRKKKCIIVSIISLIIITAIIVAIHFYVQWDDEWVNNAPCSGIPGCQVIKTLGSGAFGDVYHVQVSGAEPPDAALKVFKDLGTDPKERLCKWEKDSLLDIASHEADKGEKLQIGHVRKDIPGVDCPRLMLEYIDGTNVEKLTKFRGKPMSKLVEFGISMMEQIYNNVLQPMHNWDIYHGDIKSGNIVYNSNDESFHAVDFGLAVSVLKPREPRDPDHAFFGGTLLYVSKTHVGLLHKLKVNRRLNGDAVEDVLGAQPDSARRAEYYSLAMSAIHFIGQNCEDLDNRLCQLGKDVVTQWNQLPPNAVQEFVGYDKIEIERMMTPIWTLVRDAVKNYTFFRGPDRKFLQMLWDWRLLWGLMQL